MSKPFAFIIHPIDPQRDVSRKFPTLGKLPVWLIDFLSLFFPPIYISEITGIQSVANGRFTKGWFIACPLTPARMMSLPPQLVYRKIVQTGRYAERLGARLLGLGAFTSVVGDGGVTIANNLDIPVTTGDSYTVSVAVKAILKAAKIMDIPIEKSTVAIVGATGAIGSVCAEMIAPLARKVILIGRRPDRLKEVAKKVSSSGGQVDISTDIDQISQGQFIITVTSALDSVIHPSLLRKGAVICDVARPRDVSSQVIKERPDVLVIEGGMVEVPGKVDFGFDFGFPAKMAYACMAETIALSLEQKYESYTLGKNITLSQVLTIDKIAKKHGFKLNGFRSFERAVTETQLKQIKAFNQTAPQQQVNQSMVDRQPLIHTAPL